MRNYEMQENNLFLLDNSQPLNPLMIIETQ